MSYQVLARKWRPGNFDELVGQSHVLKALSSALDNDRIHHAYLFTGTRGVGKTTISRILARCLNCEQGVSSKPCGTCSACNEITEGRFVDLIEVDAASKTKVDDTRELLENVQYRPTRGRYKVYLIDEVHMLSTSSFNALLKTLEEPPPHVVFLLATTDPQKLPATVLSRCLQFHLKNMQPTDISNHLAFILGEESIEFDVPALESLAWSAKGSMRDALSLLDQAIAFGDGKVFDTDVRDMLGTIDRDQVYRIITTLAEGDGATCMAIIEELSQFAPDYEDVLAELLSVLHRIALIQQIPTASLATQDQQQIETLAETLPAEDVQLFYQLALHGRRDLPLAPDARSGFEMCMLRLMNFRPATAASAKASVGVSHAKKSESSLQKAEIVADVVGVIAESQPKPKLKPTQEINNHQNIVDFSIKDSNDEEEHFDDPRDSLTGPENATLEAKPIVASSPNINTDTTVVASAKDYLTRPIRSPLIRDQNRSIKAEPVMPVPVVPVPVVDKPIAKLVPVAVPETVEAENVEVEPELETGLETGLETELVEEVNTSDQEDTPSYSVETEPTVIMEENFPTIDEISVQNWYLVINAANITGVTEQMALNSQFISFDGAELKLSLNNQVRSMLNPEHMNKLKAAVNSLYSGSYTVTMTEQDPDYETPRQRRERIQNERYQTACDNLHNDPQIQGLLKIFEATLNVETIETLLPKTI